MSYESGVSSVSHNTQISLNKQKLGETQVYLKPVEQTLYSATVPIKKNGSGVSCVTELPFPVCHITSCDLQSHVTCVEKYQCIHRNTANHSK